ncbi:uncharacterized protein MYCFIDRAFT_203694 [Pseudocercospora fijiensis CIRAD86]|uniref:Uncharacterized protein n=1 Tax=Pseudocercospora fijiensis (strain CIRAD86) TaxID=383855 RepID=M3B2N6_PSEFD|nr:uncharacterized protein MYCFIDRAFT_203694 [Pseudocercospora fijiensis CIRAD86]EME83628.1 hypothetical protein MYCFIDRAFT_203694 [Pseudocercospora fijiensis CIRAD86]
MHFTSILAVITASAISHALAAPVANADADANPISTLITRTDDAKSAVNQAAQQADLRDQAQETWAKFFCVPTWPYYCTKETYSVSTPNPPSNNKHGYGVQVEADGTTVFNYGNSQLGFHRDGSVFYKDTDGKNCDVTNKGGPKGDGCAQYLYLTGGGGPVFPGTVDQCVFFGVNCM